MRKFFGLTFFKIILALLIMVFPLVVMFFYNKSTTISESEGTLKIEVSPSMEILNNISNIILFPVRIANTPFEKLFGENYFKNISGELPSELLYINLFLFSVFLISLFLESYILSCIISYLINKLKKKLTQTGSLQS